MSATGKTPLEVMIETMRGLFDEGKKIEAAAIAKDAAPYIHPKLSAIDHKVDGNLTVNLKQF